MSWHSKVLWSEGLFLRPHHLQQSDRYLENLVESRVRHVTPYPWGFSLLEIDRDLAQQGKFSLRRAAGVMPDGTPFAIPDGSPIPPPIDVPDTAAQQICWLSLPVAAPNTREVDDATTESASRFVSAAETVIDSTSALRVEEEIDVAHPRLGFELRKTAKPGYIGLAAGFFPNIVPYDMTFRQAASQDNALGLMLVGVGILLPVILGYTIWVYWLFRGKVTPDAGYH